MTKKKPLVSVIMNCFNGEKYLKYSIESVIRQTYKNWELIFWDNKSSDNSAKIAQSYKDKRIKYFYAKNKTVLYKARNLAIKKTKGEFIAFIDVDDMWSKNKLSVQIPKFKDKKVGLVYSNFYRYYNNKKKKLGYNTVLPSGKITSSIIKNYQVAFLTIVIRKKFVNRKQVFDFKYDLISDYDYILEFSLKHNFKSINKPLAYYRIHIDQLQKKKMITQAEQFCKWFKKKKIEIKFKDYDLSSIYKKYEYFDLIRNLKKSKIKLIMKTIKKFDFMNFIKISILILFPKKIVFRFIDNV